MLLALILAVAGCGPADDGKDASCPVIFTGQSILNPVPEWEAGASDIAGLGNTTGRIAFFEGDPAQGGKPIPPVASGSTLTWKLAEGHDPSKIWQQCTYKRTTVVLTRPAPARARECTAIDRNNMQRLQCR